MAITMFDSLSSYRVLSLIICVINFTLLIVVALWFYSMWSIIAVIIRRIFKTLCTIKVWTAVSFRHTQTSRVSVWISTMVMIKVQCTWWSLQSKLISISQHALQQEYIMLNCLSIFFYYYICFYFWCCFCCSFLVACFVMFRVLSDYCVDCHRCWDSYAESWCLCWFKSSSSSKPFFYTMYF